MAKIGTLTQNAQTIYPRTIGEAIAVDGTILSLKLSGMTISIEELESNLEGLSVEDDKEPMDIQFYNKTDVDALLLKLKNELTDKVNNTSPEKITKTDIDSLFVIWNQI